MGSVGGIRDWLLIIGREGGGGQQNGKIAGPSLKTG